MSSPEPKKKRGRPQVRVKRSFYKNVGRGVPLRSQARKLICAARDYFQSEKQNNGPLLPIAKVVARTAAALKINKNTVSKVCAERKKNIAEGGGGELCTPNKQRPRPCKVTFVDAFQKEAIRQHIYDYYKRKDYPTLDKLFASLEKAELFKGSKSSLRNVIKKIGFRYKKLGSRKVYLERPDIVALRCEFLRKIKNENFDKIIWLDETWVNSNHSMSSGWTDDSATGTMPVPLGKGGRLILLHAGSSAGFVNNCKLLFSSKKTSDFHEEMNYETFYNWFKNCLLPELNEQTLIVMDNASYHSKIHDKPPNMRNKKSAMSEWLERHNIPYGLDYKKAELFKLIALNKPQRPRYMIDELAKDAGHTVIRLPPYHCHFNPIELI